MDVKDLTVSLIRTILKGNPVIVTHRDRDMFAVIPMEMLILLESLQFEELEQENGGYDEIGSILRELEKR